MRAGFPVATRGMVVGLLGGSFDPAHEGHVHITREALKRLGQDQVEIGRVQPCGQLLSQPGGEWQLMADCVEKPSDVKYAYCMLWAG